MGGEEKEKYIRLMDCIYEKQFAIRFDLNAIWIVWESN